MTHDQRQWDEEPQRVFLLWHSHGKGDGKTDDKLLGVYSSRARAEERWQRALALPGFRDVPEGFLIDEYVVDHDQWAEGFVTATGCE